MSLSQHQVWFVTGSQHLYGEEALREVAAHSQEVAAALNAAASIPVEVVFKPIATTTESIRTLCQQAEADPACAGLICWMHTFSPAKMWISGLQTLRKPYAHLHTQFGRDIPWSTIDMDYMNLNQSAHGGREFGFIGARLRKERTVVVGHWQDPAVQLRLGTWARAAAAWNEWQGATIVRFGDNMRRVAVTEGDKVEAEMRLGYAVDGYGVGDLVARVNAVSDAAVEKLCAEYDETYVMAPALAAGGARRAALADAARIELGMRDFLGANERFIAFTDTFEDLHGLKQLPGIAVQRLMADGYGFGGEGDWKTAALVRAMKTMAEGLDGGTSFMEDYVYHLDPSGMQVLGAHMLEVCPSIAASKASCEIHPLGIGGKEDPVRLVFNAAPGAALNASMIDLGERFRLLVNTVEAVTPPQDLPNLPVARALWEAHPDLPTAAAAWIHAGGAHHTGYSTAIGLDHLEDFAGMAGIELAVIDQDTRLRQFRNELRWSEAAYRLNL
ncbi:MAG: L-arabinose isomerase [Planctomycetota bacterium]|jgi:L-arabinose isomerase|nr:L-arabinose isomerase [Planctomycetota bacterium]